MTPSWGGALSFAKGEQETPFGKITSSWEKKENSIVYHCTIPANTTAHLSLPSSCHSSVQILEGAAITDTAAVSGVADFELVSGSYTFKIC